MTPARFLDDLAEIMGVERTELATVDRSLAKSGLRQIAKGRFRPDITLREGVQIVLAWAASGNLTEAADEIDRLKRFVFVDADDEPLKDPGFVKIFGNTPQALSGKAFQELIELAARSLGTGAVAASDLRVSLEKNGRVEISYRDQNKQPITLKFFEPGKLLFRSKPHVNIQVTLSGVVLKWIFDATEGA